MGKSQLCLGLLLSVALPHTCGGVEGTVMIIDTEGKFSAPRLASMAQARAPQLQHWSDVNAVLGRCLVSKPGSAGELSTLLSGLEATVGEQRIQLVVLDSIASLMRLDLGEAGQAGERSEVIGRHGALLKRVAERYKIPVVITNQVGSGAFRGGGGTRKPTFVKGLGNKGKVALDCCGECCSYAEHNCATYVWCNFAQPVYSELQGLGQFFQGF